MLLFPDVKILPTKKLAMSQLLIVFPKYNKSGQEEGEGNTWRIFE